MKNIKDLKLFSASLLLSGALALTLTACSNNTQTAEITSDTTAIEQLAEEDSITSNIEDADSAVETAIGIMVESADQLAQSSDEAKETEAYQEAKEEAIDNFATLYGFLFEGEEVAGHTIDEVKDSTRERAANALQDIDEDLNEIAPNYKEKIKEKYNDFKDYLNSDEFKDKLAEDYNKIQDKWQDLKDYGNDIKERAKNKR